MSVRLESVFADLDRSLNRLGLQDLAMGDTLRRLDFQVQELAATAQRFPSAL